MAGLFITFEGVEGCGKSTQIELLAGLLHRQGRRVLRLLEPGGTDLGDGLRRILLDPRFMGMDDRAEALLYAASRAQLVSEKIRPALEAGDIVLCDRYLDSSLAYQVYGRGLDFQTVLSVNEWATDRLLPDLTILLRVPAEVGLERTAGRRLDRLEQEDLRFHQLVEAGYENLAVKYAERYTVIDGLAAKEEVHEAVVRAIKRVL